MAFVITVILFVAVYWPMFVRPPQFCVQKEFVSEEGERLGYPHDFGKQEIFAHPEGGLVYNFVHGKERINEPFHPLETLLTIRKVYKNNDPSNQYCYVYPDANYWYTLYRLSRAKYSPFKAPQSAEYSAQLPRIESCIRALREVNSGLNVSVDDFVYDEQTKGWDIRLFGKALRNIEPLRGFPNVRVLVLANCEVEDLSIVATLQQLDCLVLYNMPKLVDSNRSRDFAFNLNRKLHNGGHGHGLCHPRRPSRPRRRA